MNMCQYNKFVGCNVKGCNTCEFYVVYQQGRRDAIDEFLKKITNISYVADVGTAYQRVVVNLEYAEAIAERMKGEAE